MLTTKIKTYLNIGKISIFKPVNLNVYLKLDGVALLITDPPPASSTPLSKFWTPNGKFKVGRLTFSPPSPPSHPLCTHQER